MAVVSNNLRVIVLSLWTPCYFGHLGHASSETFSGLISLDAGLQAVAWPKPPHVVNRYRAHTTSPRRTEHIQEVTCDPMVALAAPTHDMISATCATSHHTLHAYAHPPMCCTLYAAGRPMPPWHRINSLLMCHQVVSQYTRTRVTHIMKACQVRHTIVFFVFCHLWSGHQCSSTCPTPLQRATRTARERAQNTSPPTPGRHTRSRRTLIADQNGTMGANTQPRARTIRRRPPPLPEQKDGFMTWYTMLT